MSAAAPLSDIFAGGFADPVVDSQAMFRTILSAMAEPAKPLDCRPRGFGPPPMTPLMASVALTLTDPDTPVWLDPQLAASDAGRWLAFHTGAPLVEHPSEAAFAFVVEPLRMPSLQSFCLGTAEYPDRSTTLVVAVDGFETAGAPVFDGPGFAAPRRFAPTPMSPRLSDDIAANRALFPRGVDLVFVAAASLAALPRSSSIGAE